MGFAGLASIVTESSAFCLHDAVMVPGYSPDQVAHDDLLNATYAHFLDSDVLVRVGERLQPSSVAGFGKDYHVKSVHACAVVRNLQRLVVLDRNIASQYDSRQGRFALARGENAHEYKLISGRIQHQDFWTDASKNENLYVSMCSLVPGIAEKICRSCEDEVNTQENGTWHTGGVVQRSLGNSFLTMRMPGGAFSEMGDGSIVCAYDLLTSNASFSDLRYVKEARQSPGSHFDANHFERRFQFPATLVWNVRHVRSCVNAFTAGVYR